MTYTVYDAKTGEVPDLEKIIKKEKWAKHLVCDLIGFFLSEDGELILADACGNFVPCPENRFLIKWEEE